MSWTSIAAIYLLFWVITAFVVMPFGVRTSDELGIEKVRGQADSAPANFKPLRVICDHHGHVGGGFRHVLCQLSQWLDSAFGCQHFRQATGGLVIASGLVRCAARLACDFFNLRVTSCLIA